jgi:hypothetical protein
MMAEQAVHKYEAITLGDRESFERTHNEAYPDPFHCIETVF